jgi:S1-C subfamily serine protease
MPIFPSGAARALALSAACLLSIPLQAGELVRTVAAVKGSVVGVGTNMATRSPATIFSGTGFVVGDGLSVITNAHVVPDQLDTEKRESLGVVIARGADIEFRSAVVVALDRTHDLAHLRIGGTPLPAMKLGNSEAAAEGQELAFTGFPLGMVLGLHPATHRALLAAITPVVMPSLSSRKLDARAITQLQRSPFAIFQLDGTAYPGNSGSPVYDPESGTVLAVINQTLVRGLKENAITHPSGIAYAIPVRYVSELLQQKSP